MDICQEKELLHIKKMLLTKLRIAKIGRQTTDTAEGSNIELI